MSHKKSCFLLCILLLIGSSATARSRSPQSSELKQGDTAPELMLTKLLHAPEGAKADSRGLKGKVVVLEFWASWCAPCIAAMPHLNELADKFKDRNVRFIAITYENESIVAPFLKRRTMNAWVGLDTDRSTMKSYSVKFFPTTVVVDRNGRVAIITQPKNLTEQMLSDVVDGKSVYTAQERSGVAKSPVEKPTEQDDVKPLFAMTIKPITATSTNWSIKPGMIRGRMTLKGALRMIHGISETRIVGPAVSNESYFEISASMLEGDKDVLKSILERAIEASFRLKVHREMREMEVFVLTAPKEGEIRLRPNSSQMGHSSDDEGVLAASAVPFRALTDGVESVLKMPVVDETNLKGNYDWDVLFDAKNPISIVEALQHDLGLELKRTRRRVEVLVVEME